LCLGDPVAQIRLQVEIVAIEPADAGTGRLPPSDRVPPAPTLRLRRCATPPVGNMGASGRNGRLQAHAPQGYAAKVVRINPSPAPSKQRPLVEFSGSWPDYEPMASGDFEPLIH
jgi:hypothetical protein